MRWFWEIDRFDSGVPMETSWDRVVQGIQPFLTIAFAALAIAFVRPMAFVDGSITAAGLLRLGLVSGCAVLLLTVRVPDRIIGLRRRVWIATAIAVVAGLFMGLAGQGWGGTFAYMVAVHSGVRFPARVATQIVALCVGIAVAASLLSTDHVFTPWWANLLVFGALVPGMTRRTRRLTLAAAHDVVEQTRRAAASEAESRAMAERATIARDIHDVLAHSLSGVNMQLSLAQALFDSGQADRGRDAVATAQRLVVTGLDEARAAVQTLRGDTLDPVEAIGRMVTGAAESFSTAGQVRPLPRRVVHTLVRVAQEALTNARRHAPGATVTIALDYQPDAVTLTVRNTREGGTPPSTGSGLGLVGMRERVAQVNGTVEAGPITAESEFVGGWQVRARIPADEGQA